MLVISVEVRLSVRSGTLGSHEASVSRCFDIPDDPDTPGVPHQPSLSLSVSVSLCIYIYIHT